MVVQASGGPSVDYTPFEGVLQLNRQLSREN
jgi:hypothetical protein